LVLLAGLVTSLVQTVLWPQTGWRFAVSTLDQTAAAPESIESELIAPSDTAGAPDRSVASKSSAAPPATPLHLTWAWSLVALTVGSLAWGVTGWARHWLAFRALQAGCVPVTEGRAWTLLEQLRQQVPGCPEVELVTADEACEPAAWALPQPTILLPERAERELDDGALAALLAHELAHLARHDAGWLQVARLACACLSVQPLNHLVRREWQRAAECLGDDWAVRQTGDPLALARCLTTVAGWRTEPALSPATLAALGTRSDLTVRVERLLQHSSEVARGQTDGGRMIAPLVSLAVGLSAVMLVPGVTLTATPSSPAGIATGAGASAETFAQSTRRESEDDRPDFTQVLTTDDAVGTTSWADLGAPSNSSRTATTVFVPVVWTVCERVLVGAVGRVWERTVVVRTARGEVRWIETTSTAVWSQPSPASAGDFPQIERWAL
jgi:beta-lactamase regulating signal transducer with metallopeptidase domain